VKPNKPVKPVKPGKSTPPPVGVVLQKCTVPNTFALPFADGPMKYTMQLLALLRQYNIKATFFTNGKNWWDPINNPAWAESVKAAYADGHQIASHTYSHANLPNLSPDQIRNEMNTMDTLLYNTIGKHVRYMRPPYGAVDDKVLPVLKELGYVVINWSIETRDTYTKSASESVKAIATGLQGADIHTKGPISLSHDTEESSALELVPLVAPLVRNAGLRFVTVAECFGDAAGMYR